MNLIGYHKALHKESVQDTAENILNRAAHKGHLFRKAILWDIALYLWTGVLGFLLHFASPLLSFFPFLAGIIPVNESIWEHMKLLFFPSAVFAVIRRLFTSKLQHGLLTTYAEGLLLSMGLMISGFYTYSGILGTHTLQADIALFYLCLLILTCYVHKRCFRQKKSSVPGLIILLVLTGCFYYFTYFPPRIGIFQIS